MKEIINNKKNKQKKSLLAIINATLMGNLPVYNLMAVLYHT